LGLTASCTTTTIAWTFGLTADSFIRMPLEQIDMWAQVWYATTAGEKQETRFNWHTKLSNMLKDGCLSEACGPAAATIEALLEIGWKPIRPDFWGIDETTSVKLDAQPFTRLQIIAKATNDLQRKVWKEAAKHQHGSGLEAGIPSFSAARKAIKYFRKNGLHNAAKALEYALVGFFRDPEEGDDRTITCCHRCGKRAKATIFHII